jgi:hypothetical protein
VLAIIRPQPCRSLPITPFLDNCRAADQPGAISFNRDAKWIASTESAFFVKSGLLPITHTHGLDGWASSAFTPAPPRLELDSVYRHLVI